METALIEKAIQGDREAFAELHAPLEQPLAAFLYRMVAVRLDAEDLAQETALAALESIADFPNGQSFRTWIFRIAASRALEYLNGRKPWDPDALIRAGENPAIRNRLKQLHKSAPCTTYNLREHIDFCFAYMCRTLPAGERAALLLADVHGFGAEETAQTLGITAQLVRFRVRQARETLAGQYGSHCSLVNKNGCCTQCARFDMMLYAERKHTEQAFFAVELGGGLEPRLALVRAIDPLRAEGARLHESLMSFTREVSGYW